MDEFKGLEDRLRYRFLDPSHLRDALRHASYLNEHAIMPRNTQGRLAFLGDAVLDLAVSVALMRERGSEGVLTVARARQVRNDHLANIGERLQIPLMLGGSEADNAAGGTKRRATAVEAILGAVYLDAGPAHAIEVVLALFTLHDRDG